MDKYAKDEMKAGPGTLLHTKVLVFTLSLILALSCTVLGGKPSTSAPGGGFESQSEFWEACDERDRAISLWEQEDQEKLTGKFADGEITFLRFGLDSEAIEKEADGMEQELMDNCLARAYEEFPSRRTPVPTSRPERDDPLPTPTRR